MRPIIITNTIYKVLESRFIDEFRDAFWKLKGTAKSQFGFMRGMSCSAQLTRMYSRILRIWNRNSKEEYELKPPHERIPHISSTFGLFIDIEQAYNSVNLWLLYNKMSEEIDRKILNINLQHLQFVFYMIRRLNIRIGKQKFQPKHGVPQGGILSPILFNFSMHYMLEEWLLIVNSLLLTEGYPTISSDDLGLWADDMLVVFDLPDSNSITRNYLRIITKTLRITALKWGLRINWKKSGLIKFFKNLKSKTYAMKISDHPSKVPEWTNNSTQIVLDMGP